MSKTFFLIISFSLFVSTLYAQQQYNGFLQNGEPVFISLANNLRGSYSIGEDAKKVVDVYGKLDQQTQIIKLYNKSGKKLFFELGLSSDKTRLDGVFYEKNVQQSFFAEKGTRPGEDQQTSLVIAQCANESYNQLKNRLPIDYLKRDLPFEVLKKKEKNYLLNLKNSNPLPNTESLPAYVLEHSTDQIRMSNGGVKAPESEHEVFITYQLSTIKEGQKHLVVVVDEVARYSSVEEHSFYLLIFERRADAWFNVTKNILAENIETLFAEHTAITSLSLIGDYAYSILSSEELKINPNREGLSLEGEQNLHLQWREGKLMKGDL